MGLEFVLETEIEVREASIDIIRRQKRLVPHPSKDRGVLKPMVTIRMVAIVNEKVDATRSAQPFDELAAGLARIQSDESPIRPVLVTQKGSGRGAHIEAREGPRAIPLKGVEDEKRRNAMGYAALDHAPGRSKSD